MPVPHRGALSAVVAVVLLLGAFMVLRPRAKTPSEAPYPLCVAQLPKSAWRGAPIASGEIVEALGRSLSPDQRVGLRTALDTSADLWEVRANPMVEPLEDAAPDEPVETWMKTAPREVGIALAALRGRFCGNDGFCVEPANDRGSCEPGFELATSPRDQKRAAFLALPFGAAREVPGDSEDRIRTIEARARSLPHGVLVVAPSSAGPSLPDVALLRASLDRYEGMKAIAQSAHGGSDTGRPRFPPLRKLRITTGSVLLVPSGTIHRDEAGWEREVALLRAP